MITRDFETFSLKDLQATALAAQYLAHLLQQRQLTLLLGAGVSVGAGLPKWEELVQRCEVAAGLDSASNRSSQELMQAIGRVQRKLGESGDEGRLLDIVRDALYLDFQGMDNYPHAILAHRTLVSIGALVMASSRGSIGDVFTLNFDDLLEWYLRLHGFRTQVVSDFPRDLRGDVDVTIFHPHGFIPLVDRYYARSDWIVLSHRELVKRLAGEPDKPWPTLLESRFLTKRLLAVGTSMNDLDIDVHLERARSAIGQRSLMGFVVDVGISDDRQAELREVGLVPVVLGDYSEIPDFLLSVCQLAAELG